MKYLRKILHRLVVHKNWSHQTSVWSSGCCSL